jgi:phospholipase C
LNCRQPARSRPATRSANLRNDKHRDTLAMRIKSPRTDKRPCAFFGRLFTLVFAGLLFESPSVRAQGIPIKHFIFIIQENHSFDSYFGTFPGANGIPAGTMLPDYPGGPRVNKPFLLQRTHVLSDFPHSWVAAKIDYDNGAMDGFLWGEYPAGRSYYGQGIATPAPIPGLVHVHPKDTTPLPQVREVRSPHGFADDEDPEAPDIEEQNEALSVAQASPSGSPNPADRPKYVIDSIGYMDATIIPNYWEYASKFTLCDAFFSSITGPSLPNHLYTIAAQSGGAAGDLGLSRGKEVTFSFPSIIELFGQSNVTWKYYTGSNPKETTIWNPLPGFRAFAKDFTLDSHFALTKRFYADLNAGTLPQVCWLTPTFALSEHPPEDVQAGMWYVTRLINAVMRSSYWNSCAIILMWDDYGGFYDHVPPIQTDEYGFGFRVPAIVISPYSKSGTIVHTQYDLTSPLKLVETAFGLSSLTPRDGGSNTMLDCFDFSETPLPPVIITQETKLDFSQMVRTSP